MKRGLLFSLFVITALSLIVFTFKTRVEFKEQQRADIFKERVEHINLFLEDMQKDIERSLYVATFRAFLGVDEFIHLNRSKGIDNASLRISELILNGTIYGKQMNITNASTFSDWEQRIQQLAKRFNINITFKNSAVTVRQSNPWIINVSFKSNVEVEDFEHVIAWNFSVEEITVIDIADAHFPDPLYFKWSLDNYEDHAGNISGGKPLLNSIRRTPYSVFWTNDSGFINVSNLLDHTINQYYINNTLAPSYLSRLENPDDFSGYDEYGIESLVNVINMTHWFYSRKNGEICAVDWRFFTEDGCEEMHKVINMNDRFLLNNNSLAFYGLTKINAS